MHDLDIDKELAELIATVRARTIDLNTRSLLGRHTPDVESEQKPEPVEPDLAAFEPFEPFVETMAAMPPASAELVTWELMDYEVNRRFDQACEALEKSHLR